MSHTNELVAKVDAFLKQDQKLGQMSQSEGLLSQSQSDALIREMEVLTALQAEVGRALAACGDLAEHLSGIEEGVEQWRRTLESGAGKVVKVGFFQGLFLATDVEKMKAKKDVGGLFRLMMSDLGDVCLRAFEALVAVDGVSLASFLLTKNGLAWDQKEAAAVMLVLTAVREPMAGPLTSILSRPGSSHVESAALALGLRGEAGAADCFVRILEDDARGNWFARIIAARYAGRVLGAAAQQPLIRLLNDEDPILAAKGTRIVIDALGEIGGPEGADALVKTMKKDVTPEVRQAVERALGKIKARGAGALKEAAPKATAIFGGLGEPYCSQRCLDEGGKYISAVMLKGQAGICGFCKKETRASMYGEPLCAVVPYQGISLFACTSCAPKAKAFFKTCGQCVSCQKAL